MTIELKQTPMTLKMNNESGVMEAQQPIVCELGPEASDN